LIDGPKSQLKVTDADIQVMPGNSAAAFTLVHNI
jgi:hypothetical protein